jgi:DNA-binding SARP family transcriptional activator
MTDLRLLGALEIRSSHPDQDRNGLTQPKRVALLLYLALAEPAGLHLRDRLLALLWPEADDASARHSLRNALHTLRQALGDSAIVTRGEAWVGLDFQGLRCDVLELRAHLAAGRVSEAVALWAGDLAPGFFVTGAPDFEHWLDEQRTFLRQAVRTAAWKRADALAGSGEEALDAARQAMRLDPGNEAGAGRLMRQLAASGNRTGALQVYQDLADWLARELETGPSAEMQALATEIRHSPPAQRIFRTSEVSGAPAGPSSAPAPARFMPSLRRRLTRPMLTLGLAGVMAVCGGVYLSRKPAPVFDPAAEGERAVLRLPARYRADTSAYSSYLRGLSLRFRFRFAESRDTLSALVDREPLYVPGLYGLAHAWIYLALDNQTAPDEAWPRVDELARRAIALDSTAAGAWVALASEGMFGHLDLPRAGQQLARARSLDPLDPDVPGMLSIWYRFYGQMDSAVALAREARHLDPLSLYFGRLVAEQLYFARRYDESRRTFLALVRDYPAVWPRINLDFAQLFIAMHEPREAVEWLRRGRLESGDTAGADALRPAGTDAEARMLLARDLRRRLAQLGQQRNGAEPVAPSRYALAYAMLGDTASTLGWLDSMLVHRDVCEHHVRVDPSFDFLRGTAAYRAWEAQTGLPAIAMASKLGMRQ